MILFHGTNTDFQQMRLDMSRVGKDFGYGFYLTTDKQVATRQAERKLLQYETGAKVVQSYYLDEKKLDGLKVLRFDAYTEEWADFILLNRQNKERRSLHDYDVVIGPIADDTVGFQIRRYTEGIITKSLFLEEIKYHHVTMQYFFGTERALTLLERR